MSECNLTTCKHIDDLERELAEVRACLREIVETWDNEASSFIEDGCCPMVGPDSLETLVRWRTAAGYDTANTSISSGGDV